MNILIIGAGAIGSLVGGRLALAGQSVTLVGRQKFADVVRANGLWLYDTKGRRHVTNVQVTGGMGEAFADTSAAYDLAILTVKSYDTDAATGELATATSLSGAPVPALLSLQNGVGNEEMIASCFPTATLMAGTITTPVSVPETGVIQVDKPNNTIGLSHWQPSTPDTMLDNVARGLEQAGFAPRIYSNPRGMKWTKLLMNMLGNATSAILDLPPQAVFNDPALVNVEIGAWQEAMTVMAASGIPAVNLGGYPFALLAPILRILPRPALRAILRRRIGAARGGKMPSLHIDLQNGRRNSEVGWLNGAVARQGTQCAVNTPINHMLTEILTALANDPAQRHSWRHNVDRLIAAI